MEQLDRPRYSKIRKIIIGDVKNGFNFEVGRILNKSQMEITEIVLDENWMVWYGRVKYIVYARRLNGTEQMEWKSCEDQPVLIEYFIDE